MIESKESTNNDISLIDLLDEADRRHAREDCVFFIDNYLMTYDPRPESYPHDLDFVTYEFQRELVKELIDAINNGTELFIEKSRDMGASWTVVAVILHCWLFMPGFQALLGSWREDYVEKRGDIKALFQKLDYLIMKIKDPLILPEGFNLKDDECRTFMKLRNPQNGNAIIGESPSANFGRGGRFRLVLFDELGFWPHDKSSWEAASESTRCRIAITTPPNHPTWTKVHRFSGMVKVLTYHWRRHPNKDNAWYEYQKGRKNEDEMLHEIDISWEYSSTGVPYPEISNIKRGSYPYDPNAPLYISIDLGLDAVALGWYQPIVNTNWIVLIEAFEASNHVIDWYLPFFGREFSSAYDYTQKDLEFIKSIRHWKEATFFGDPSGKQRHVESGVSPYSIMYKAGIKVQVNDMENDWVARRDSTKRLITHLAMNDTPRTEWWLECMKNAHYPKRNEESQSTTPITKPVHDWTSHHRTQTEYFSVNYKGVKESPADRRDPTYTTDVYIDNQGNMVAGQLDVAKILHDANRKRRR